MIILIIGYFPTHMMLIRRIDNRIGIKAMTFLAIKKDV